MSVLDLGTVSSENPFSFDNASPKQTPTGLRFKTYRGYRMYLITGSKNPMWLRAVSPEDFASLMEANEPYIHVWELHEKLEEVLRLNIACRPIINLVANRETVVKWSGTPTSSECGWVIAVQNVISQM